MLTDEVVRNALFAAIGFLLKFAWDTFRQKTKVLPYSVTHAPVGITTNDEVFGNVEVTWQGKVRHNLFLSTATLSNSTLTDFSKLTVTISGGNGTILLTGATRVHGVTRSIPYSEAFEKALVVSNGDTPTASQQTLYNSRREYELPVFNRNEKVEFTYLTTVTADRSGPILFLDASFPGLRTKLTTPSLELFGVPVRAAALTGTFVCLLCLLIITGVSNVSAVHTGVALGAGLIASFIGVAVLKSLKFVRRAFH